MKAKIDVGASAEYLFASELLYRGLIPSWPSTESMPYDMIVDTGKRRFRVQVKGSNKTTPTVEFSLHMRDKKGTKRYTKENVDFIVLFLFSHGVWYIFPVSEVRGSVRIKPGDIWCKCRPYRNAWHLLDKSLKED